MTAETKPTLSLHRKLAQVMWEAERIPKNGTAPKEMGGYSFVQVGDAADYIRKALAEKVITMMPVGVQVVGQVDRVTSRGGNMTTVDLVTTWRLTDGESGESIEIQSFGAGADGGDKYSGKAMTSAMKYALLAGFLLSTGEDTEASNLPEQRAPAERNPRVGAADHEPPPAPTDTNGGLIGVAEKTDKRTGDFAVRQSPDGAFLGFRLKGEGRRGWLIEAHGGLAEALSVIESFVIGQRVQVWGTFEKRDLSNGGSYEAFVLERIQGPEFVLPGSTEPAEPESLPLFDEDTEAELDAAATAA